MASVSFADTVDTIDADGKQDIQMAVEEERDKALKGGALLGGRRRRKRGRGLLGGRRKRKRHSSRSKSRKRVGSKGAWQRVMKAAVKQAAAKYRRGRAMLY